MMRMNGTSTDIVSIANSPLLWILAIVVLGVVLLQSTIYMIAVRKNAEGAGMSQREVYQSFRAGGVAAIGPSLAVVLVAIALLPLFGTPAILVRIGLIGSAATAGVTGAIVMLTLTLSTLGLPLEGVGLLLAIDPILDMGRTATNVAGQALVPTLVAKREGILDDAIYNSEREGEAWREDDRLVAA